VIFRALVRPVARSVRTARAHAGGAAAYFAGASAGRAQVSYAQRVPDDRQIAVGGIVKLQHLARTFPEAGSRFNVLYLVTSRLPAASVVRADWARRKGARLVVNQNGVAYPGWYGPGWQAVNAEMRALLVRADYVFYQSEFCRTAADQFAAPARGAWEVLHNAVDTSRFTPGPKQEGRPLTLLLAGSQDQWYRLESAVRTLAVLVKRGVDAELLIAGRLRWTGNALAARQQADALVSTLRLNGRVVFLGVYPQADAPAMFRRADVVLHTKYNDPCPTVVIEALACGRPVVYSRSGGVPELVGDDAGVGIETELSWERDIAPDPEALAEGVNRVRANLATFAAAARARAVERFDVEHWIARHREVLEDLVA
jgi:glycosyltransferase involved in cell wall biosynthesis